MLLLSCHSFRFNQYHRRSCGRMNVVLFKQFAKKINVGDELGLRSTGGKGKILEKVKLGYWKVEILDNNNNATSSSSSLPSFSSIPLDSSIGSNSDNLSPLGSSSSVVIQVLKSSDFLKANENDNINCDTRKVSKRKKTSKKAPLASLISSEPVLNINSTNSLLKSNIVSAGVPRNNDSVDDDNSIITLTGNEKAVAFGNLKQQLSKNFKSSSSSILTPTPSSISTSASIATCEGISNTNAELKQSYQSSQACFPTETTTPQSSPSSSPSSSFSSDPLQQQQQPLIHIITAPPETHAKTTRWIIFSDLHVKGASIDTCEEVLQTVHETAVARKAGELIYNHIRQ